MANPRPLPISSVDHISLLCSCVEESAAFYERVLGFVPIKRPGSFAFDGAWLFSHGIGIHLIQSACAARLPTDKEINPRDYHLSFQSACQDVSEIEERLQELGVRHKRVQVEEGGIFVDQIFFHDPDGFMIEVCTCDNLPLEPLRSSPSSLSTLNNHVSFGCSQQQYGFRPTSGTLHGTAAMELHKAL